MAELKRRHLVAGGAVALLACGGAAVVANRHQTPTPTSVPSVSASCHFNGPLPDPVCTPGSTVGGLPRSALCPVAHTKSIRPPVSYTDALKRRQMAAYGVTAPASLVEEDHLIPLELGGAPRDPKNLWPEFRGGPQGAAQKDLVENAAHDAVCRGRDLAQTQREMATDWMALGKALGVL